MTTTFGILGPLDVVRDGAHLELGGSKQRALLAALVLRANEVVPADVLIDAVWGDRPPGQARVSLRAYLSNLRAVLELHGRGGEPRVLLTRAPGYLLVANEDQIDALRFRNKAAAGAERLRAADHAGALPVLEEALALWRGDPLVELQATDFAQGEITQLLELRQAAQEDRIDALLACGRTAEALAEAERLIVAEPLRERLRGQQMLGRYRMGRQADALEAYSAFRELLADELGIDPSPALQRLEAQILRQSPDLDVPDQRAPGQAASAPQQSDVRRSPRARSADLVGRDAELATIAGWIERAGAGAGGLVLLSGEPGIGKTALLQEATALARDSGAAVAWGRSYAGVGAPALWPWVEILRELAEGMDEQRLAKTVGWHAAELAQLVPAIAAGLAGELPALRLDDAPNQFRISDAIAGFLQRASATQPVVVILDDLHWADSATLRALTYLAPAVNDRRLLVFGAYREEAATAGSLAAALADLARAPAFERLTLSGLDETAVGDLIRSAAGEAPAAAAASVRERTGGNPFFVRELVRLLGSQGLEPLDGAEIPTAVRDVVLQRLASLGDDAVRTLTVAAFEREWFRTDVLSRALGLDQVVLLDHLERALDAQLIVEHPHDVEAFRFQHALVREALMSSVSALRGARIHAELGRAGEAVGTIAVEDLARHFDHGVPAGTAREAITYARQAAGIAVQNLACDVAAEHLRRALAALDRPGEDDPPTRIDVLVELGFALRHMDAADEARAILLDAAARARELGDVERLARATVTLGGTYWGSWPRFGLVDEALVAALEDLVQRPDLERATRVLLQSRLAAELYFTPRVEDRDRLSREAVAIAQSLDNPRVLCQALLGRHLAVWSPDNVEERLVLADHLVRLTATPDLMDLRATALHLRSVGRLETGDAAGSLRDFHALEEVCNSYRLSGSAINVAWGHALRAQISGSTEDALRAAEEAVALHAKVDAEDAYVTHVMFRYRRAVIDGCVASLVGDIRKALHMDGAGVAHGWLAPLAHALAVAGETDEAAAVVTKVLTGDTPRNLLWLKVNADLALSIAVLNDAAAAEVVFARMLPYRGQIIVMGTGEFCTGAVDHFLGVLAAAAGDRERAAALLEDAVVLHERIGATALARWSRSALSSLPA